MCEYAERKLLLKLQQDAECHNVFFSSLFFCYFFPTFNAYRPHACLLHIEVPWYDLYSCHFLCKLSVFYGSALVHPWVSQSLPESKLVSISKPSELSGCVSDCHQQVCLIYTEVTGVFDVWRRLECTGPAPICILDCDLLHANGYFDKQENTVRQARTQALVISRQKEFNTFLRKHCFWSTSV